MQYYTPPRYVPDEKRPRQYAAEIRVLPQRERAAAIKRVPEHLRQWVRDYLAVEHDLNTLAARGRQP